MVLQALVEVNVCATRRVEASQQLADDNQQLGRCRLLDETTFYFFLVGFRILEARQYVLGIGIVLVAFVALRGLARNRVVVGLVGSDDADARREIRVLEQPVVMARVVY